jgi:hypothetical protein
MDWFRMYSEFANDPKVQSLPEAMQRRLVMLLCLRCSNTLVTLHDDEIAFSLRITESELAETKAVFVRKGFINDTWEIQNWDKRQFVSDSSASRVARHRAKVKEQTATSDVTPCNVTVTPQIQNRTDTDTEQNIEAPSGAVTTAPAEDDQVSKQSKDVPACPVGEIVNAFHDLMPMNPRVRLLDDARKKTIRARWREASMLTIKPFGYTTSADGLAAWKQFFEVCADSPFLTGRTKAQEGRPPFVADIDFLMSPSGFKKCLENKYHREAP